MYVVKRNGKQERVQFDKITSRISKLAYNLNTQFVDPGKTAFLCDWEFEIQESEGEVQSIIVLYVLMLHEFRRSCLIPSEGY
jgi:hypothetical protein